MQFQRHVKSEPVKRGRGKKRNGSSESYYPQYLAERHFPSSQDPLAITVLVEIDGRKQDKTYPATLTIKHCFDNYFSYFLDLPQELRACIRQAGEILGWSQVDELTIKISLGTPKTEDQVEGGNSGQEAAQQTTTTSNNSTDDQRTVPTSAQTASGGEVSALNSHLATKANPEMYNPKALEVPINTSLSRYSTQMGAAEQASPTDPSPSNPASSNFQGLLPPQPQLQPHLFGKGGSVQFQETVRSPYGAAARMEPHPSSRMQAQQAQLLHQGTHRHNISSNPAPFRNAQFDQPGNNADSLYYNQLAGDAAPGTANTTHASQANSLGYNSQPPFKRLRYGEGGMPTANQLDPAVPLTKAGQVTMRSLNGGPALHVRPTSLPDDDSLDAASWDQYMNSMIDPSERLWVPDSSLDAALAGHDLLQHPNSSLPVDNARIPAASGGPDILRNDLAGNGTLRSPTHPESASDRSFLGYSQQHLSTGPRMQGHAADLSASNPASSATHLAGVNQMNGLDCLPQGAATLSRHNSYSPTQTSPGYDVSIMVAELLHMVGYLKPTFRDRAILMVALRKCTIGDLASVHAAMKGAWDRKSIAEARQILCNILDAQPLTHLVTEGLGLTNVPHASMQFPYLTPGLQGAAQLEESLMEVLIFLQANSDLRAEVMQCLQQMSSSERQVINTGLVDACVRRNAEDLQGVVYSIITP